MAVGMERDRSTVHRRPRPHRNAGPAAARRLVSAVPVSPAPTPISVVPADRPPHPVRRCRSGSTSPAILSKAARHRARWAWEARYLRVLIVADLCVGLFAAVLAFDLRFGDKFTPYNTRYFLFSRAPTADLHGLAGRQSGLREAAPVRRHRRVSTGHPGRTGLTATIALISYACEIRLARGYVVIALPLATLMCVITRFTLRKVLHRARRRRGACMRRVIVVGHELAVVGITRQLRRERYHGLKVVGACVPPINTRGFHDGQVGDIPVLGTFDEVAPAIRRVGADTVLVLSCPELDGHALRRLAWRLERDDIDLIVASSLVDVAGDRTTIRPVDGLPMLHVEHPTLVGARRVVKTVFDRVGALLLLAGLSPLLATLAFAVRMDSPGPVLFRQVRVGKDGREFVMFKFRTMHTDAEARLAELRHLNEGDGVLFKLRDDPRVTRVGRFLRKFSLDELPQLLNVLTGKHVAGGPAPAAAAGGRRLRRRRAPPARRPARYDRVVAGVRPLGPAVGRGGPSRPAIRRKLVAIA